MLAVRPLRAEKIQPPRWNGEFAVPATMPLDIEIGCGAGLHPIRYARANSDRYLVAIEHTRTRFGLFEGRIKNHEPLSNLLPVHADAVAWIVHHVPMASVSRFFLLYPNPNHHWYSMPFFGRIVETLKPGGELTLATNLEPYARDARRYFEEAWGLQIVQDRDFSEKAPLFEDFKPRTHFEKKYLARGETCHQVVVRKS